MSSVTSSSLFILSAPISSYEDGSRVTCFMAYFVVPLYPVKIFPNEPWSVARISLNIPMQKDRFLLFEGMTLRTDSLAY